MHVAILFWGSLLMACVGLVVGAIVGGVVGGILGLLAGLAPAPPTPPYFFQADWAFVTMRNGAYNGAGVLGLAGAVTGIILCIRSLTGSGLPSPARTGAIVSVTLTGILVALIAVGLYATYHPSAIARTADAAVGAAVVILSFLAGGALTGGVVGGSIELFGQGDSGRSPDPGAWRSG